MNKSILALAMVALLCAPAIPYADTIYSWKDKDGVMRYSSEPPPEGVTDYQTTTSEITGGSDRAPTNRRRSSYDTMVQEATEEADQSQKERQERETAQAAEKKRIAEEKNRAQIEAQRKELEQQIEAIKNRAVSPTMPHGMKQAQIEELEKKIAELEKGADTSGAPTETSGAKPEKSDTKY